MAHFDVASNGTTGVVIAAAATGQRARFLAIGIANTAAAATDYTVVIYDGTAAAGTARIRLRVVGGASYYFTADSYMHSVFPKTWFTAGNAIEFAINAGTTEVRVWGELAREV